MSAEVMRYALAELGGESERMTRHTLKFDYGAAGAIKDRVAVGEIADVAIIQKPSMDALAAQWCAAASSLLLGQAWG